MYFGSVIKSAAISALAAICMGIAPLAVQAQSTYATPTSTIGNSVASWSSVPATSAGVQGSIPDLTAPQFNSTLGTLTSVTITWTWTSHQEYSITSTDVNDEQFYIDDAVTVTTTLPSGAVLSGGPPDLILGAQELDPIFGVYMPTGILPAGATLSAGPVDATATQTITLSTANGDVLTPFIGTGNVSFPTTGMAVFSLNAQGGNYGMSPNTTAGAAISVVYTYTPPASSNTKTGCIEGVVWNDKNGDGKCGEGSKIGIGAGIKINLYKGNDCGNSTISKSVYTAEDGSYEFDGLKNKCSYRISIDTTTLPKGYKLTTKSTIVATTLANGQGCISGEDFGCTLQNTGCGHTTFAQDDWNDDSRTSAHRGCLEQYFGEVYQTNCVKIGGSKNYCYFDSATAVRNFLTQGTGCQQLPQGATHNPYKGAYGCLAGELLTATLNCDFSDAGVFRSGFKNLCIQSGKFKGRTIKQVCDVANALISGEKCPAGVTPVKCTLQDVSDCLHQVNSAYRGEGGECSNYGGDDDQRSNGGRDGHGDGHGCPRNGDCSGNKGCGDGGNHDNRGGSRYCK